MRCCDPGFKSGPLTTFSSHLQVLHCRELGMNAITVLEQYSELDLLLQVGWQTEGWWRAHMFPCAADAGSPARRTSAALSPTPAPAAVPFACQPQASERLGVRPSIGIRAKLTTRHQGHWGSTSGDKAKVCGWGGGGGEGAGGSAPMLCCPAFCRLSSLPLPGSPLTLVSVCSPRTAVWSARPRDRGGGEPPDRRGHAGLPQPAALSCRLPDHKHPHRKGGEGC